MIIIKPPRPKTSLSPFHLTTRKCRKLLQQQRQKNAPLIGNPSPNSINYSSYTMSSDPPKEKAIPNHGRAKTATDPILQNALRYTISAKEYETLHKYIISRSKVLRRNAPSV